MSKHRNDISQIRKYTSGELDAHAMHQLERQALDDPFLADALEGYQNAGNDQRANLADLSERLKTRTDEKVKRLIPWGPLSIAASILVVIGVGIWLMTSNNNVALKQQVAANVNPAEKKEQPVISSPSATISKRNTDSAIKSTDVFASAKRKSRAQRPNTHAGNEVNPPALADLKISEPVSNDKNVPQPLRSKWADTLHVSAKANTPPSANGFYQADKLANNDVLKPQEKDKSNSYGYSNEVVVPDQATQFKSTPQSTDATKKLAYNQPSLLQSKVDGLDVKPQYKSIAGRVTDLVGTPLAGAVVRANGNSFGVVTDENGRFIIHDAPDKKNLTVGYIGYDSKQVKVIGDDSVNIALSPTKTMLKGVADQGSMASKKASDAHPTAGWKALDAYLKKNAVLPDGQTGKVDLSFTVDAQGNLNDFKVLKSLNAAADQKAIDLLSKGPGWVGAADGQSHEVKVTVEFK